MRRVKQLAIAKSIIFLWCTIFYQSDSNSESPRSGRSRKSAAVLHRYLLLTANRNTLASSSQLADQLENVSGTRIAPVNARRCLINTDLCLQWLVRHCIGYITISTTIGMVKVSRSHKNENMYFLQINVEFKL